MHIRGYHVFPAKIFGLTVPKNFVGNPSMFQKKLGYRKNLCIFGGITIFRRNFFVFLSHSAEKLRKGTL